MGIVMGTSAGGGAAAGSGGGGGSGGWMSQSQAGLGCILQGPIWGHAGVLSSHLLLLRVDCIRKPWEWRVLGIVC